MPSPTFPNDWSPLTPTETYVFKPVERCQYGGPRAIIWLPEADAVKDREAGAPLSIFIHGGAFTAGGGLHVPNAQVRYWLAHGYVVASLEYRMLPHFDLAGCRSDVLDGYRWLVTDLETVLTKGGHDVKIDTSRSVSCGGSAGGTLSTMLAIDIDTQNRTSTSPALPRLSATISAYPLADPNKQMRGSKTDFYEGLKRDDPEELAIAEGLSEEEACVDFDFPRDLPTSKVPRAVWLRTTFHYKAHNSFLCNQEGPPYADTHCCTKLITPTLPPTTILAAGSDEAIPKIASYDLRDAYVAEGVEVHLREAMDAPHAFMEIPAGWKEGTNWWDGVILPALEWAREKSEGP